MMKFEDKGLSLAIHTAVQREEKSGLREKAVFRADRI